MSAEGRKGPATDADTGRTCPYCRFPLKAGVEIVECSFCSSPHHSDCWADNGGCAVVACAGGPGQTTGSQEATAVASTTPPAPPTPITVAGSAAAGVGAAGAKQPPPPPTPTPPTTSGGSRFPWVAAAILVLALAIGGGAAAYIMQPADEESSSSTTTEASTTSSTTTTVDTTTDLAPASALPAVSDSQMEKQISNFLLTWHEAIVNGEYRKAWYLLTPRKQAQNLADDPYSVWQEGQASLTPYLQPAGLKASIVDADDKTGVVTVDVTGMGWTAPGSACTKWEGITWVMYENGRWRYDPGYSTTPERTREWKPRVGELLGVGC